MKAACQGESPWSRWGAGGDSGLEGRCECPWVTAGQFQRMKYAS